MLYHTGEREGFTMPTQEKIIIRGLRQNNLKNVSLDLSLIHI